MKNDTMLFGTDFSDPSIWAAHHAAEFAKKLNYDFELVHVVDPKQKDQVDSESRLESIAKEIEEKSAVEVETEVHEGAPAKLLARLAREEKYIMVSVGYTGMSGLLSRLGSVSSRMVRLVDKPVLVLIPNHHNEGPVIGCIDFSDQTDMINYWTHSMADLLGREAIFTHVAVPFETIVAATPNTGGFGMAEAVLTRFGGSEEGYQTRLESSVRHRLGIGTEGEVDILLNHSASHAISDFSLAKKASLVVLGRHGHNTIGARIIGSTAEKIMNQSHSSVLVLP